MLFLVSIFSSAKTFSSLYEFSAFDSPFSTEFLEPTVLEKNVADVASAKPPELMNLNSHHRDLRV